MCIVTYLLVVTSSSVFCLNDSHYHNNGAWLASLVAASMVNVHERFSKSLVALVLHFGCFDVSPDHSHGEKTSPKYCAKPQSLSFWETTIAEEEGSSLETS